MFFLVGFFDFVHWVCFIDAGYDATDRILAFIIAAILVDPAQCEIGPPYGNQPEGRTQANGSPTDPIQIQWSTHQAIDQAKEAGQPEDAYGCCATTSASISAYCKRRGYQGYQVFSHPISPFRSAYADDL